VVDLSAVVMWITGCAPDSRPWRSGFRAPLTPRWIKFTVLTMLTPLTKTSDTQRQILEAAVVLFVRDGLDALSMRRVAAEVGVTATALYRHFANRDHLVDQIAELGFARLEERLLKVEEERLTPTRILEERLMAFVDFCVEEPKFFELMFVRARPHLRKFPVDFKARRSRTFELVRTAVARCMECSDLAEDSSSEVTLDLWALQQGLLVLYLAGRFGDDPKALRRLCRKSLHRQLRGLGHVAQEAKETTS